MSESYVEVREDGAVRLAGTLAYPEATVALDTSGGAGIIFPSADPHVAGAWWDNGVTLMRSAG